MMREISVNDTVREIDILVTDGHILGHRLKASQRGKKFLTMAVSALALAVVAVSPVLTNRFQAGEILAGFRTNPDEAVTLPGWEGKFPYQLAKLSSIPVVGGMTRAEYDGLLSATAKDIASQDFEFTAISGLGRGTTITSTAKVLDADKIAEFKHGVVALNKDKTSAYLIGFVNGKLEITSFGQRGCWSWFSETELNCKRMTRSESVLQIYNNIINAGRDK